MHILFIIFSIRGEAQSFAPGAGFFGSTAIHKDSSIFIDWANSAEIFPSYMNIAFPENGYADYGTDTSATGIADGNPNIVSLGDGGCAVLSFEFPVTNGKGYDFAVFENGFFKNNTSENAFLELAFVEVSTDGKEYVRFPAVSELQTDSQIGSFGYINARYIHNFAGKYTVNYGTPFDLEDISEYTDGTTVDLNNINYIKIIDVIGSTDSEFACYDSKGNIINDPYPTPFLSGGFDLDAAGVINNSVKSIVLSNGIFVYPNPTGDILNFKTENNTVYSINIFSFNGLLKFSSKDMQNIDVHLLKPGMYILQVCGDKACFSAKFIKL